MRIMLRHCVNQVATLRDLFLATYVATLRDLVATLRDPCSIICDFARPVMRLCATQVAILWDSSPLQEFGVSVAESPFRLDISVET